MKEQYSLATLSTALLLGCGFATSASAAEFLMLNDPSLSTGFEQRWNDPNIWSLQSGVDDGANGIPDGTDTFIINRNTGAPWPGGAGATDLSNEGMPAHSIAGITATGAPGRDMVLKVVDTTIGNLTVLASASTFEIVEERDKNLTINGIISGAGNLQLTRAGGFSTVDPGEVITITGASPNTITGTFTLRNANNDNPLENAYFVADKVGAFGQAASLTVSAQNNASTTTLRLTTNTTGGEGAIDDDATSVILSDNASFDVDAGVDEFIGSGLLTVNGNTIADGVYNNSESWIVGDGTITVGVPEPSSLALLGLGGLLIARRRRG